MKSFLASLLAVACSAKSSEEYWNDVEWINYLVKYGKFYNNVEEMKYRRQLFRDYDYIVNAINDDSNRTHTAGHNQFSDMTWDEYRAVLGLRDTDVATALKELSLEEYDRLVDPKQSLRSSWDWRDYGKVTPVKNQGTQCGSGWAFSAIGAIESAHMIAGNQEVIMSEQHLIDCSLKKNSGCQGGWYLWGYDFLKSYYTMKASDVPFTGESGECLDDKGNGVMTNLGGCERSIGTQENLAQILKQPVNVAIAAGNDIFRSYSSGILTADSGCGHDVDHAALAVGYGEENGVQYYIVRNSWGTMWGEDGYVRIATGGNQGVCGINMYVYYPTFTEPVQLTPPTEPSLNVVV